MNMPTSLEALTSNWLTAVLRERGVIHRARITSIDSQTLGEVTGASGELARLHLTYDVAEAGAPSSLMIKLSAPNPAMRADLHALNLYQREVWFYEEIASQVTLRTPHCYYSHINAETGEHILLLEDLAPIHSGGERFGICTPVEVELAVRQIAEFHAAWWQSPQLANMEHLWRFTPAMSQQIQSLYQQRWDPFLEKVGHTLPEPLLEVGRQFGERMPEFWQIMEEPPQTMLHGDLNLGNLIFQADQTGALSMAVIDWQVTALGRGPSDVALLLCMNMKPEDRKAQESALLKLYHSTLVENGVAGYSFAQCWDDYRLLTLNRLLRMVFLIGGGNVTEGEYQMFLKTFLPFCVAAILELDAGALLPD